MNSKTITFVSSRLFLSAVVCLAPLSALASSSIEEEVVKILSIEDSSQRLSAYDTLAKSLKESPKSPKPLPKDLIIALHSLKANLETGISYKDFSTSLMEIKTQSSISKGELSPTAKMQLDTLISQLSDMKTFWGKQVSPVRKGDMYTLGYVRAPYDLIEALEPHKDTKVGWHEMKLVSSSSYVHFSSAMPILFSQVSAKIDSLTQ